MNSVEILKCCVSVALFFFFIVKIFCCYIFKKNMCAFGTTQWHEPTATYRPFHYDTVFKEAR